MANNVVNDNEDYYKNIETLDARIDREEFNNIFYLEKNFRNGNFDDIYELTNNMKNRFWKSAIFGLASYCAYKHGHKILACEYLKHVENELKPRMKLWYEYRNVRC